MRIKKPNKDVFKIIVTGNVIIDRKVTVTEIAYQNLPNKGD